MYHINKIHTNLYKLSGQKPDNLNVTHYPKILSNTNNALQKKRNNIQVPFINNKRQTCCKRRNKLFNDLCDYHI